TMNTASRTSSRMRSSRRAPTHELTQFVRRILPVLAVGLAAAWAPLAVAGEGPGEAPARELEQGVEGPVRAVFAQPVEQDPDEPMGEVYEPGTTPEPQEGPAQGDPGDDPNEIEREDSGGYFLVSPGVVQVPLDTRDVGYQWGLGLGYMVRTDSRFAMGVGINFEHGINDLGDVQLDRKPADHQFRVQGEIMPGLEFLDSRLFLYLNFGLGYAGWLQRWTQ